jgi:hypothetical protein
VYENNQPLKRLLVKHELCEDFYILYDLSCKYHLNEGNEYNIKKYMKNEGYKYTGRTLADIIKDNK